MKNETEEKQERLLDMLHRHNCPPQNLWYGNFPSDEVQNLYRELIAEKEAFEVWKYLGKNFSPDKDRVQKYYLWDIAVEEKENLAKNTYPEAFENLSDGLFKLSSHTEFHKNGFPYKDHHLIFEREFSKNFHLTNWLRENLEPTTNLFVPINEHTLGIPETRREVFLKSHWRGPQNVEQLKHQYIANELIVKGAHESVGPLDDKTEFLFTKKGQEVQMQIEELLPINGINYDETTTFHNKKISFYTRYMHIILDERLDKCYHLDGAIREYFTYDKFLSRNFSDLKQDWKKDTIRYKIFKVESEIAIAEYQKIVGLYFRNNPYVLEFFEGKNDLSYLENTRAHILEVDFKFKGWA